MNWPNSPLVERVHLSAKDQYGNCFLAALGAKRSQWKPGRRPTSHDPHFERETKSEGPVDSRLQRPILSGWPTFPNNLAREEAMEAVNRRSTLALGLTMAATPLIACPAWGKACRERPRTKGREGWKADVTRHLRGCLCSSQSPPITDTATNT